MEKIIIDMPFLNEESFMALESIKIEGEALGYPLVWGVKVDAGIISDGAGLVHLFKKHGFNVMVDLRFSHDVERCIVPLLKMKVDVVTVSDRNFISPHRKINEVICFVDDGKGMVNTFTWVYLDALNDKYSGPANTIVNHQEDISDLQQIMYGAKGIVYKDILTAKNPVDYVHEINERFI